MPYATMTAFSDILKEVYPPRKRGKNALSNVQAKKWKIPNKRPQWSPRKRDVQSKG